MNIGLFGGGQAQKQVPQTDPIFQRNAPYVVPGASGFNTSLPPDQELAFKTWLSTNDVPFDPTKTTSDYDMRGFWKALQSGDKMAASAIDPNDGRMHYPDFWKTPYHATFSNQSQWALPNAPRWTPDDKLVTSDGHIIFDDRAKNRLNKAGLFGNEN